MTETTQLGLPIYSDNDVPQWTNTNDGFEALDSLVNSCADVALDWSNPLHNFTDGNLSYTVTDDDCYLCGQTFSYTENSGLYINNKNILVGYGASGVYIWDWIPPLRLSKGDVIRASKMMPYLFVLKGKLVSGNTYVFNEAQVTLDYAHPLFTFGTNNLSYTATKKCYLLGVIPGVWDSNVTLSIDGTVIYQATYSNSVGQGKGIPILTIEKGSTVSLNRWSGSVDCLHIFDGTVTGSVSALHSNIPDYSKCITEINLNAISSYTAPQECIMEICWCAGASTRGLVKINNHTVLSANGEGDYYTGFSRAIHLQKGDVVSWTNEGSKSSISIFEPL